MVRVFLKGGVWKNSEDEVLKAAVQKYGKQQWARVASLLNRKTAKQAKARWYEWLDPSIRKVEWSRSEEEQLLHLAKLLPSQWKTIGPIIGRTATQCQEHYEYLLDQAATGSASGASGGGDEDDLRKQAATLRPGQIEAHPESKPAKPDPIDMDEDELEMLQEARARLANTMGKKAKRKQREKMLAQAKRLADLQKRRELKAAGLLSQAALKKSKRSKREIDLGVEIPFYKPAPVGFHDISQEQAKTNQMRHERWKNVDLHQVNENRYRTRDLEEAKHKKREEQRLKVLQQVNETYAKEKAALEEATLARPPRGSLQLPEPTVTDAELADWAKKQQADAAGPRSAAAASMGGLEVTQALVGDFTDRPLPTPMRTPFAPSSFSGGASVAGGTTVGGAASLKSGISRATTTTSTRRDLVQEASELRRLERRQTPLLMARGDGALDDDEEPIDDDHDHRTNDVSTSRKRAALGDDAASVGASTWASTTVAPNSIRDLARQQRRLAKRARLELDAALAALPAPQYEYELAAPSNATNDEMEEQMGVVSSVTDDDQADIEASQRAARQKQAQAKYEARSTVLKRPELPRPVTAHVALEECTRNAPTSPTLLAQRLVQEEIRTLLQHDAFAHPIASATSTTAAATSSGKKQRKRKSQDKVDVLMEEVVAARPPHKPLPVIPASALQAARLAVDAELDVLMTEKVTAVLESNQASNPDEALALLSREAIVASRSGADRMVWTEKGWMEAEENDNELVLSNLKLEFEALRKATESLRKKNDKLEAKSKVVNGGYVKVAEKCSEAILEAFANTQNARIEQSVYRMLQSQEVRGGAERIERMQDDVKRLQAMEADLQKTYGELLVERRRKIVQENAGAGPN